MRSRFAAAVAATLIAATVHAQLHDPASHDHAMHEAQRAPGGDPKDARVAVRLPGALRTHTLANMRDHLLALQQIQEALARQEYDQAADIGEQRLGMSSLALHGAHEVGRYMPPGMRAAGTAMHRAASRFALAARDAAATGDLRPALDALAQVTAQCVACHAGYRVK